MARTSKEWEIYAKQKMEDLKRMPSRWKADYLKKNYPDMVFAGKIPVKELAGHTEPTNWKGRDGSWFVKYLDYETGAIRIAKVIRVHADKLYAKTPEALMYCRRGTNKNKSYGDAMPVYFENILYALPSLKAERIDSKGNERRYDIMPLGKEKAKKESKRKGKAYNDEVHGESLLKPLRRALQGKC